MLITSLISSPLICFLNNDDTWSLKEANRNKGGTASHSSWRNYDDLNEYFWYVSGAVLVSILYLVVLIDEVFH